MVPAPQPVLLLVERRRRLADLKRALLLLRRRRRLLRSRNNRASVAHLVRCHGVAVVVGSARGYAARVRALLTRATARRVTLAFVLDGKLSVVVQLAVKVPAPSPLHLPLRLGGRERARVEPDGERGAARVVEVRAVHPAAAPAPPAVEQGLVIFHRTRVRVHAVRLGSGALPVAVPARAGVRAVVLDDARRGRNHPRTARAGGGGGHGAGPGFARPGRRELRSQISSSKFGTRAKRPSQTPPGRGGAPATRPRTSPALGERLRAETPRARARECIPKAYVSLPTTCSLRLELDFEGLSTFITRSRRQAVKQSRIKQSTGCRLEDAPFSRSRRDFFFEDA